jgi:hypothetical protein
VFSITDAAAIGFKAPAKTPSGNNFTGRNIYRIENSQ